MPRSGGRSRLASKDRRRVSSAQRVVALLLGVTSVACGSIESPDEGGAGGQAGGAMGSPDEHTPTTDLWSFLAPVRPALPPVSDEAWVNNPIDNFVLSKLEDAGLEPAPAASPGALLRRLSLDLRGLPPSPEEVSAFAADPSEAGYEALVDRWMDGAEFGEHRARYWLDVARYADTHGYHYDNYRSIWPYRDYVIDAFTSNKPFDEFTVEQLAGDLMP